PTEVVLPTPPPPDNGRGGLREVGWLAYPVILSQISSTVMGVVDSAMVGRLGATELGAVGFAGIWCWTLFSLFFGTATGVQTFVSQDHGAGNEGRCGQWAWQTLWLVVPAAVVAAGILMVVQEEALRLLGPSAELQIAASDYLRPRLIGAIGMTFAFVWISFFRGIGDTRTPMIAAIVANVLNVGLDYALIFGEFGFPAWGVTGAGVATAIGEWSYALFVFVAALGWPRIRSAFGTNPVKPQPAALRRLLHTGLPIGGQWVMDMLTFAVFTTFVARMGDTSMAASQAFVALLSMSFMQASGISVAASTLVGRYVGAGNLDAATRSFWTSQVFAGLLSVGIAALFLAAPEAMMRIFTDDPAVIALGVPLVRLGAFFQLMDAAAIVSSGALRGAGDTRWPFVAQSLLGWGLQVPLAWLLGVARGGGLHAAWIACTIYIAILSLVLFWRFRSGRWREIDI
ncbi:MAG: MATE family efflux transporter, partial [bacterium]|nr:MATE family efflux transporter [bacterium]